MADRPRPRAGASPHVRGLEAMRRAGAGVEREPDGTWIIGPAISNGRWPLNEPRHGSPRS
jgi:hypothetical protein